MTRGLQWLWSLLRTRLCRQTETTAHLKAIFKLAEGKFGHRTPHDRSPPSIPLISFVVPTYDTNPRYLDDLLASFCAQQSSLCELILSDDGSNNVNTLRWLDAHMGLPGLRVLKAGQNGGIARATNAGIAAAAGVWIGLMDHDDALAPFAVACIAETIAARPEAQFIHTDEIIADKNLRPTDYFLKPAWDPVLLSGVNYVNHLSLYRRDRLLQIGSLREGFEGSQDYDLLLRYTSSLTRTQIVHLPYPAYLWRRDGSSFSAKFLEKATENARRALCEAYKPLGFLEVEGTKHDLHRVRFDLARRNWPLVSIVIPSRDSFSLISRVLEGVFEGTEYPNLEVVVIDNGTMDERVLELYDQMGRSKTNFTIDIREEAFNFSRSVNRGIELSKGELVLLLNNDVEVIEPNWLSEMVSCFAYPETGIVGAKLLYPDGRIQHAGVIAGLGGYAGHWYIGEDADFPGPMGRLTVRQSLSVVTGACMLISRTCLNAVGPFDEEKFAVAYNDVDFCLRAVELGIRIVWTPFATLTHHESASRGSDETAANIERFTREKENLRNRHGTDVFEDRAFNPWYSRDRSNPRPVRLTELPDSR